jgi:zinc protease
MELSKVISREAADFPFIDKPVEIFKLENGHTIVIANKHGELANISTWVKTGSLNEDDSITGISHFLEHLMFKGTPSHPAGEFDRILESKGAIINAATWKDYTFYYVTFPKGENDENVQEVIELHADMMLNAMVPDEEIGPAFNPKNPNVEEKRERYVVIEEINMRDDNHWTTTYDSVNELMYEVHPYKRDVIGTAEVISSVSRETIMNYYKKWYTPQNMTTIAVGDFPNSEQVLDLIRQNFMLEAAEPTQKPVYEQEKEQLKPRNIEKTRKDINTGFVIMGFHGPKPINLAENIATEILSIILGEGKSSRLYQNLIEKQPEQIFNVVGATQYEFKEGNVFLIQGNFVPEKKTTAIDLLKSEIRKIMDEPISDTEFEKAKKKLKVGFAEEAETVSEIGEAIGHCLTVCEDISCHTEYLKTLDSITPEFIQKTAKKYLNLNKVSISLLIPE